MGKDFNSLWHNLYAIGHTFIAKNSQIFENTIWSSGHTVHTIKETFAKMSTQKRLKKLFWFILDLNFGAIFNYFYTIFEYQ